MIYTCSYKNYNNDIKKGLDITYNCGRNVNYLGNCFPTLAPNQYTIKNYLASKELLDEESNIKMFIENYYDQTLKRLDPSEIYNIINNKVLLGYEDNMEFSNRHIVAAWLEIFLEEEIIEIKFDNDKLTLVEKPIYIKEMLESYIRETTNTRGFNSLRALYLYNKSLEYEIEATSLENNSGNPNNQLIEMAYLLRQNAAETEELYNLKNIKKKKIFK